MEKRPCAKLHPDDMQRYGLVDESVIRVGNAQGEIRLHAQRFDGVQPGTLVIESLWPNANFIGGLGVNTLVSSEPGKPAGGAVFHDTAVWAKAE